MLRHTFVAAAVTLAALLPAAAMSQSTNPAPESIIEASVPELEERDRVLGDFVARYRYTMKSYGETAAYDPRTSPTETGILTVARRGRYLRVTWDRTTSRLMEDGKVAVSGNWRSYIYRDNKMHGTLAGPRYIVSDADIPGAPLSPNVYVCPPLDTDLGYILYMKELMPPRRVVEFQKDKMTPLHLSDTWSDLYVGSMIHAGTWGQARYGTKRTYLENSTTLSANQAGWQVRLADGQDHFVPASGFEVLARKGGFASKIVATDASSLTTVSTLTATSSLGEALEAIGRNDASVRRRAELELLSITPIAPEDKVSVSDSLDEIEGVKFGLTMKGYAKTFEYDEKNREFIFGLRYDEESGKWITLEEPLRLSRKREALATLPQGFASVVKQYAE